MNYTSDGQASWCMPGHKLQQAPRGLLRTSGHAGLGPCVALPGFSWSPQSLPCSWLKPWGLAPYTHMPIAQQNASSGCQLKT